MGDTDDEDGGSQVATIDSIAVEGDEDEPLPEVRTPFQPRPPRIPTLKLRKPKQHPSSDSAGVCRASRNSGNQPAFADDGRKEAGGVALARHAPSYHTEEASNMEEKDQGAE